MGRAMQVPHTLARESTEYRRKHEITRSAMGDLCGLSETTVQRVEDGLVKVISTYTLKRMNSVIHCGVSFANSEKRTRKGCSTGNLVPVPSWCITPLRDAVERLGQTDLGRIMGVEGGSLGKVMMGTQTKMRAENVAKLINWFKDAKHVGSVSGQFQEVLKLGTLHIVPKTNGKGQLPPDVHASEMNQIHDAFNGWTDSQREAFSNLAHAFRSTSRDEASANEVAVLEARVTVRNNRIEALGVQVSDLEGKLSEAEAAACRWENAYLNVKEGVETITKKLI